MDLISYNNPDSKYLINSHILWDSILTLEQVMASRSTWNHFSGNCMKMLDLIFPH